MAETGIETEDFEGTIGDAAAGAPWEDGPAGGVMAGVLASFSEHGFELGYRRAISDMIALLLLTAAEHRRDTPAGPAPAEGRRGLRRTPRRSSSDCRQ